MEEWREVIESDRRMVQKTMFVAKVAFELGVGLLENLGEVKQVVFFDSLLTMATISPPPR